MHRYKLTIGIFTLVLVYISGILGLLTSHRDWFLQYTAANLILTFGLLTLFQKNSWKPYWLTFILIFITGFLLEIVGVNTGIPFGVYSYGDVLGPKYKGTPYLIGINWFIMSYGAAAMVNYFSSNIFVKAFLVGTTIMALDIVIEPVAINLGFWWWSKPDIPIQNYISWLAAGSFMGFIVFKILKTIENKIAVYVFMAQVFFFTSLRLLL